MASLRYFELYSTFTSISGDARISAASLIPLVYRTREDAMAAAFKIYDAGGIVRELRGPNGFLLSATVIYAAYLETIKKGPAGT